MPLALSGSGFALAMSPVLSELVVALLRGPSAWCGGSCLGARIHQSWGQSFSRSWLPTVEALGYLRHPTSILAMQLLNAV